MRQPLNELRQFMPNSERAALLQSLAGEERSFFVTMLLELADRVLGMPITYQQQNVADPIVYLHYFKNGCDWYITEKDCDPDNEGQHQAFGWANLGDDDNAEFGYISIPELCACGVELDLYWQVRPLSEIRGS